MTTGHLSIAFDRKNPAATFIWPDAREAMTLIYVKTADHVMYLITADQRRITLPLGETVEPVPGVRMKFYEESRRRVRIEAAKDIRIVR